MTSGSRNAWIVVPAYNEEEVCSQFLSRLTEFLGQRFGGATAYAFTVLIVNDGSTDGTEREVIRFMRSWSSPLVGVKLLSFTRNFGHQAAVIAGLARAIAQGADLVISMDGDGEHPVTAIPEMIEHWEKGARIVHTLRRPNQALSWGKRLSSAMYYRLLRLLSGVRVRPGMADFKLWDGDLLRHVREFLPDCGSTRVFASWLCPDGPAIEFDQDVRLGRTSRFGLRKMSSLAVGGIVRFSVLPLRLSFLFGLLSVTFSLLFSIFVVTSYLEGKTLGGWASTILAVTITAGLQALMTGFLGEYLLRHIFQKTLPRFVIAKSVEGRGDEDRP